MTTDSKSLKHRSVPITETITSISGYPKKLVIFKIPASGFWWCRYFTQKKVIKKSTKTENKREAIEFSKKFYEEILLRERNLLPLTSSPTFEKCSYGLIEEQEQLIKRGERNELMNRNDLQKLKKDILPFFRGFDIREINYKHLNDFVTHLHQRDLKPSSIKNHLNLVHKILMYGLRENLIDKVPPTPKVKMKDSPRGWFNRDEYSLLRNTVKKLILENRVVRYHQITDEMRFLITFMVNTFVRPSDIKNLRHRNIQIIKDQHTYLRIQTEKSKTTNSPIVSMENAVGIYTELVEFQKKNDRPCGKDDFVFFPHLPNREFGLQTMRRQFDEILKECGMKLSPNGEPRTLYSLRHTSIMFRLTMGEQIDLLTLARNARTSVEMIERFYARPLNSEMNVDKLQSMRKRSKDR